MGKVLTKITCTGWDKIRTAVGLAYVPELFQPGPV